MEYCIIHYAEVGLKKANRGRFVNILIENIRGKLGRDIEAQREYGLTILSCKREVDWLTLRHIPGISNFYLAGKMLEKNLDMIKSEALEAVNGRQFDSFKVETARHNKDFQLKSVELNTLIGQIIVDTHSKRVDLTRPDLTIYIKICDTGAFVSTERHEGLGGLPVGSTGRALCLLSGGIDSPVAAYLMMKRGLKMRFIHFKPKSAFNDKGESKIVQLVNILGKFQARSELIIIDFSKIQDEIITCVFADYRMLVYRRFMIRIAEHYSKYLVTGDNLGQVASQTLDNLNSVYKTATGIVMSPLLGYSKNEIIDIAREIGTYEQSIRKYPDCCTYFVPRHPELKAEPDNLDLTESELDIPALVKLGVDSAEIIKI